MIVKACYNNSDFLFDLYVYKTLYTTESLKVFLIGKRIDLLIDSRIDKENKFITNDRKR